MGLSLERMQRLLRKKLLAALGERMTALKLTVHWRG